MIDPDTDNVTPVGADRDRSSWDRSLDGGTERTRGRWPAC